MFVFYDTETTGLSREFDQILQFAAIRTDDRLREIDRFEIRCRCLPWIVPAPMALHVTGVTPDMLDDGTLPTSYEMMTKVRSRLGHWTPAIHVGYNSMRFDEPRLQQALWQALHPPYLTCTDGNARMDIMPLVQAASHLRPGALEHPLKDDGRPGFRLDRLAPLNGFDHANAHDALADVEATVHIARLLAERCPELWRNAVHTAPKQVMAARIAYGKPLLFLDHFGQPDAWWGLRVDGDGPDTRAAVCLRLDVEWDEMFALAPDALKARLEASPRPLRHVPLNKAPVVLDRATAARFGQDLPPAARRQGKRLLENAVACRKLIETAEAIREPWPAPEQLEQRIYDRFPSRLDKVQMKRFHHADWTGKAALIDSFHDPRLRCLARRIVFASNPDLLPETERRRIREGIAQRLHADPGSEAPWRTIPQALEETRDAQLAEGGKTFAPDFRRWLKEKGEQYLLCA